MDRKGIVVSGPVLIMVNLFALLFAAIKIGAGLAVVLGLMYNRQVRGDWKGWLVRGSVFLILTILLVVVVHFIIGPMGNHHLGLVVATPIFAGILSLISWKSWSQDAKHTGIMVAVSTGLFILVSQLAVLLQ